MRESHLLENSIKTLLYLCHRGRLQMFFYGVTLVSEFYTKMLV